MIRALLFIPLIAFAALATALPTAVQHMEPTVWQQWGSGEVSRLGFRLYRATLWVAGGEPQRAPTALQLDYRRDIRGTTLVESSISEMRRLGANEEQLTRWQRALSDVLPDVKAGDSLVAVFRPGDSISPGVTFFHGNHQIGEISDAEFGRAFFAIWLDPATRAPELRAALLKRPQG
ncbi:hypothetical protein HCX48_13285 [Rhodocyclus tenuis]|uniref:Chalcone isomerase domain-containing protein n=1 Tax=Rhodocyclus gracilis TaxID=2929842 RepID=A0ABX0WMM4_9RHOO|nr:chalcone isomerase family protein [Rhodocyclus gracilis]NJA90188.1 hypothetical protein [Rhodocyclus gracilis]